MTGAGNLGGEAELAAIWAAVRVIRAGCRGLLRELMQLAHDAGVLCDESVPAVQAASGTTAAEQLPPELDECPVPPPGGAVAALVAAVEASLHCPLWGSENDAEDAAELPDDPALGADLRLRLAGGAARADNARVSPPHRAVIDDLALQQHAFADGT